MAEVSDLPTKVSSNLCSKTCIDTVKRYRDHNQKMSDDLKRLEKDIKDYVRIVERFEEQIKGFQANELQHSYDTKTLFYLWQTESSCQILKSERNHVAKKSVKSKSHIKKKTVKESVNMWVPKSTKTVSTATTNSAADNDSAARSNTTATSVRTANSVSTFKGNQQLKGKSIWHVDCGCSRYMTGNMSRLKNFKKIDGGHVAFGNTPDGGKISGKGDVTKGKMTFEDVFYVEQLRYNLLSVSQVVDEKMILLRTPRKDNVYCLDMESVSTDSSLNCLVSKASLDESHEL
ncbi:hypothetical protein L6452_37814 [Arctium lappa]|uniref:Uncharacterized protein n=1 Tax=Arctium lappa TaxID=4217 RepID=A0ACB8Y4I4_ARCLA|nr:hypothetical protein L6452_37814 [Arctium lappa]